MPGGPSSPLHGPVLGISALFLCRKEYGPRGVLQQWHFFLLATFYNLRRFIKHDNILRTMNISNHPNETNVVISLRVSISNHLKLVHIYLPNPVFRFFTVKRVFLFYVEIDRYHMLLKII